MAIKKATTTDDLKQEAKPVVDGYTELVGPGGQVTSVPDSILDVLLDSGYVKK
jgi:hypothetical protein